LVLNTLIGNYLNIAEKHAFDMPNFAFMLYNNIVVPIWVDFDRAVGPKRGVVKEYFRLSKMVSLI
jgi:hypothetical protein